MQLELQQEWANPQHSVTRFGLGFSQGKSKVEAGNTICGTYRGYDTTVYCTGINTEVIDGSLLNKEFE